MTDKSVSLVEETGTSTSLLARAVARHSEAWDRLVTLYGPLVYYWCRQAGLQPRDAENLGQEVFLKVWRSLDDLRRDRPGSSFRGWLRRITHNCIIDQFRRQSPVEATGGTSVRLMLENIPAEDPSEESKAASEDKAILYKQAVELIRAEFSERDWQAFRGVVIEDKSTAEVAASLGVAPNVIYLAKSRVLRRLKEEFTGLID